ncbi:MAG: hypothetical protein R3C61_19180 [Bacteroidia bacterium]
MAPLNSHGRGTPPRLSVHYDQNTWTEPLTDWHLHHALGNHNTGSQGSNTYAFNTPLFTTTTSISATGPSFSTSTAFAAGSSQGNNTSNTASIAFNLNMQTPRYVIQDFHELRNNIAAIRSIPGKWSYVQQYYNSAWVAANQMMGKVDAHYQFSGHLNQNYTLSIKYMRPSNGNSTQRDGTNVNREFRY